MTDHENIDPFSAEKTISSQKKKRAGRLIQLSEENSELAHPFQQLQLQEENILIEKE